MNLSPKLTIIICSCSLMACQSVIDTSSQPEPIPDSVVALIDTVQSLQKPVVNNTLTYGIDISRYQKYEIDSISAANDSLSFVICRATEGNTYIDPYFKLNWDNIRKKGLIRGAYHFYMTDDLPKDQATNYLGAIVGLDSLDLPPIVDFEGGSIVGKQSSEEIVDALKTFLDILAGETGRTPIIYTNLDIGNTYLNDTMFEPYTLWIANYTHDTVPQQPKIWQNSKWTFWQRSNQHEIDNIKNDFDLFNGDIDDLRDFIKQSHTSH